MLGRLKYQDFLVLFPKSEVSHGYLTQVHATKLYNDHATEEYVCSRRKKPLAA